MKAKLETALDEIILQNPGPTPSPVSDRLISDLEMHHATAEIFTPFKGIPDCMQGVAWHQFTRPSTKVALLVEVELLSAEKLDRLKELAATHAADIAEQIKYSPTSALRDYEAQRTKLHADASNRSDDLAASKFLSRESIQQDYHEKVGAITERMKLIVKDAFPLVKEAVIAAESALKSFLRVQEESDREVCAAYDLEWKPSLVWQAACANLINVRNKIQSYCARSDQGPEQLLDGLLGVNLVNLK